MKAIKIGKHTVNLPIVQGGMGVGISLSNLASAVANEGGIGVISAVGIGMTEPGYRTNFRKSNIIALRKIIRKARSQTDGVIGVNVMLAVSDSDDLLKTAIEEKIDIILLSAGLPLKMPENLLKDTDTAFIPKVSSAKAAKLIFRTWLNKYNRIPDAIVIEGPLSGGHQGFKKDDLQNPQIKLQDLVADCKEALHEYKDMSGNNIPIIAAGGIYTGSDMFEILESGADAVKIGTRFITTHECDAALEFKENYLNCKEEDITIIDSPVGLPARVISNDFVKDIQNGKTKPVNCPWKCLKTCNYKEVSFCIAEALFNAAQGKLSEGFSFGSVNAHKATKIQSVKSVIEELTLEYYQQEKIKKEKLLVRD